MDSQEKDGLDDILRDAVLAGADLWGVMRLIEAKYRARCAERDHARAWCAYWRDRAFGWTSSFVPLTEPASDGWHGNTCAVPARTRSRDEPRSPLAARIVAEGHTSPTLAAIMESAMLGFGEEEG